jgi:hypothetical protein
MAAGESAAAAAKRFAVGRATASRWMQAAHAAGRREAKRMGGGRAPRINGAVKTVLLDLLGGADNQLTLAQCRDRLAERTGGRAGRDRSDPGGRSSRAGYRRSAPGLADSDGRCRRAQPGAAGGRGRVRGADHHGAPAWAQSVRRAGLRRGAVRALDTGERVGRD